MISPLTTAGTYDEKTYHYSVLRTLEDGYGVSQHLGDANHVTPPINAVWAASR